MASQTKFGKIKAVNLTKYQWNHGYKTIFVEIYSTPIKEKAVVRERFIKTLTLFRMGIFGAAHEWGEGGGGKNETWHSYTYLKKIQEIYELRNTLPNFCWHQHFFTGNQQVLLFQKNADIDCILVHNF